MQYRWWRVTFCVLLLLSVVVSCAEACVGSDGTIPSWGGSGPNGIMVEKAVKAWSSAAPGAKAPPAPPIRGTHPVVIVLIQNASAGVTFAHSTRADWANRIDEIAQYYTEVSMGNFTIEPAIENDSAIGGVPNDGVIGPVNVSGLTTSTSIMGSESKAMVVKAIRAINPYINFASYDADHSGTIEADELHLLIHQAGDEASFSMSSTPKAWAHMLWQTPMLSGLDPASDSDGMRMTSYCYAGSEFNGTRMATMGVMTHELGHDIGLPDLYDTQGNWDGLGQHCLMSYGSWGGNYGDSPVHLDGFFKSWLGWANTKTLTAPGNQPITLNAANGSNDVLRVNVAGSPEFFVVENRQQTGFDQGLPGSAGGLAIYHCDGQILTDQNIRIERGVNDSYWNPGIQVEEADAPPFALMSTGDGNRGSDSDYFRAGNNDWFAASSSPNSRLKDGTASGLNITQVSASGSTMTLTLGTPSTNELRITTQPQSANRVVGQSVTLAVVAAGGTAPYHYQWQKNGANIGSDSAQLAMNALTSDNAGSYRCVVTDSATPTPAQVISNTATLTVSPVPALHITTQPAGGTYDIGDNVTLSVAVSGGTAPYHYQWKKSGANVGTSSAQLPLGAVVAADAGSYTCTVTDSATPAAQVTSSAATIQVLQRQSLPAGGTVALIILAASFVLLGWFRVRWQE